ncbi:hypothetical protein OAJ27_01265 [bacterium]|nr:hypothetical protein [bacterium]
MIYKRKRFDLSIFECLNTPEQLKPLCHDIGNTKIIMMLHPSLEAQQPLIATLFDSMSIDVQEIKLLDQRLIYRAKKNYTSLSYIIMGFLGLGLSAFFVYCQHSNETLIQYLTHLQMQLDSLVHIQERKPKTLVQYSRPIINELVEHPLILESITFQHPFSLAFTYFSSPEASPVRLSSPYTLTLLSAHPQVHYYELAIPSVL